MTVRAGLHRLGDDGRHRWHGASAFTSTVGRAGPFDKAAKTPSIGLDGDGRADLAVTMTSIPHEGFDANSVIQA